MRVFCIGWTEVVSHINCLESDEDNTAFMMSNISCSQFGKMCVCVYVWRKHSLVTANCYLLTQIAVIKFFWLVIIKIVVTEQNLFMWY